MSKRLDCAIRLCVLLAATFGAVACASFISADQQAGKAPGQFQSGSLAVDPRPSPEAAIASRGPSGIEHIPEGVIQDTPRPTRTSTDEPMIRTSNGMRVDKSRLELAPEITSSTWLNTDPLASADLRGKVVVVQFWTFDCINCRNTLPYVTGWFEKYRDRGLTVIGVHTPELSFERDVDNVKRAVSDYHIKYPVAIDGDYSNWNHYHVMAWPTWFILDKEGYIRYSHIGEGDYAGSEAMIVKLLGE